MSESLQAFIRHAREKGLDHATIRTLLLAAGWKEKEIAANIAHEGLDLPVPEPAGAHSARDAFLYLLLFTSLYITITSVIVLLYTYLDYLYPDPGWSDWSADLALDTIRYAIAAVLVSFPLFVLLTIFLDHMRAASTDGQMHPTRRWLVYLTLFLAATVSLCDVITLLFYFLDGSLTTRFVLKAIVLLVVFQIVLSYYFFAPRVAQRGGSPVRLRQALVTAALTIVAGSVALGFSMSGSPLTARSQRLDEKRVADLRAIRSAIRQMATDDANGYGSREATLQRPLPKTLDDVAQFRSKQQTGARLDLVDPSTGRPYAYKITGEKTYELCAEFELPREKKHELFWNHAAGKCCFQINVESPP